MTSTVVLVEQEPETSAALAGALGSRGFVVVTAPEASVAIAICREFKVRPAVIVVDVLTSIAEAELFLIAQSTAPFLAEVPVVIAMAAPPERPLPPNVRALLPRPILVADLIEIVHDCVADAGPPRVRTGEIVALERPSATALTTADGNRAK